MGLPFHNRSSYDDRGSIHITGCDLTRVTACVIWLCLNAHNLNGTLDIFIKTPVANIIKINKNYHKGSHDY